MPRRATAACSIAGCPELAAQRGMCLTHAREADRDLKRRHVWRNYGRAWRRKREQIKRLSPRCIVCGAPTIDVDHVTPLRQGGAPLDDANLQALCHSCHSRKTIAENRAVDAKPERAVRPSHRSR